MSDRSSRAGGPVIRSEEITTADQTSMIGDGTWMKPLHASGGGISGLTVAPAQSADFTAEVGFMYPLIGAAQPEPPAPPVVRTVTLPTAASAGNGALIAFAPTNVGPWDVVTSGGDTISITAQLARGGNEFMEVISDGVSEWYVRDLVVA